MDKQKFKNGFSYIEALIAAAIVSVTVVPALAMFYSAAQNQRYAADRYEAAVQAELALKYICRAGETGFAEYGADYLSFDKFDFIINDNADAVKLDYGAPRIAPAVDEHWDISDTRHVFTGPDGNILILEGPFEERNEIRAVAVDVCDKDGNLLARAAQTAR